MLCLTSVKKAFLRSIILFFPNAGKGNFPNETALPKGLLEARQWLAACSLPPKQLLPAAYLIADCSHEQTDHLGRQPLGNSGSGISHP